MPNIRSAKKRVRTAEAARTRNHARKSAFRTELRKVEAGLSKPEELPTLVRGAISALDRAAKTRAIHPRQAARRKARLMKRVNAAVGTTIDLKLDAKPVPKPTAKKAAKPAVKKAPASAEATADKPAKTAKPKKESGEEK